MSLLLLPDQEKGSEAAETVLIVFPVRTKERLYGALICIDECCRAMTTSDLEILNILTNQTSIALENKLLLEQRIRSEKLAGIGHMVSTITHDYRTPMTVVKGYAEMLETEELPASEAQKFGALIGREIDRMESMIEELLDFVRGAKGEVRLAPCTLQGVVDEVRAAFEQQFKLAGVAMEMNFPDPGAIKGDPEKLKRAFINLTKNALDAMPNGGTLRLDLEPDGNYYRLNISDTGLGIPKEALPRVFEPFFSKGKVHGLGLGTTIARSIIEEHGGGITVASEPGIGTTFTVSFPRLLVAS